MRQHDDREHPQRQLVSRTVETIDAASSWERRDEPRRASCIHVRWTSDDSSECNSIGRTRRARSSIVQKHYGNLSGGPCRPLDPADRPARTRHRARPGTASSSTAGRRVPNADPWRYQDLIVEDERAADGAIARSATVFLTGRECPWRCVMCDLWRYTTPSDTPPGAIPAQVAAARRDARGARRAAGHADEAVQRRQLLRSARGAGERLRRHRRRRSPGSTGSSSSRIRRSSALASIGSSMRSIVASRAGDGPPPQLEVAMGLETVHPDALERLHKRMTVDQFADAASRLGAPRRVGAGLSPDRAAVRAARTNRTRGCSGRSTWRSTAAPPS